MSRLLAKYLPSFLKMDFAAFSSVQWYSQQQGQQSQPQEENPFLKKYADKIAALQNSAPEEYLARLEKLNHLKSPQKGDNQNLKQEPKETKGCHSSYQNKALDDVMKLELLQDKSKEEIENIWKQYHKEKDGLYAVLPHEMYKKMFSKFQDYPTFLFPLPKDQGYEFIMSQFSANSCFFTPLIKYQAYKENAPVCLTLTYFAELMDTKGIVLMRGEYDSDVMKAPEAQCLTNQLQLYYGGDNKKKDRMLYHFNKHPETFKHMDLISELEFGLCN